MKRTSLFIDGSNFYNKMKRLIPTLHLTSFQYKDFTTFLTKSKKVDMRYYVGEIKKYDNNQKSQILYSMQQVLLNNLRNQGFTIKLGFLLKTKGIFHEKGVDVQIATDIVAGALLNEYDICYLLSSDGDLLPAVKLAQDAGKEIIYVGFERHLSKALSYHCKKRIILTAEAVEDWMKKLK